MLVSAAVSLALGVTQNRVSAIDKLIDHCVRTSVAAHRKVGG